ncbi:MAG: hypothetical protein OXU20_11690 [Myxococcales bacterium]|nr:hypothetical protein [Myxococcales bacterium]
MKILVYGAGVIGSVYAARLAQGGHDVSVLARGRRLAQIREVGIRLEQATSGERSEVRVPTVERLEPEDAYDVILVVMQKVHLPAVLPSLAENRATPYVAFIGNNAAGPEPLVQALGADRVLMGFPTIGGYFDGPLVRYAGPPKLGLTLGQLDGGTSSGLLAIKRAFEEAGIEVTLEPHIDAWLKGHVALVVPILLGLRRHDLDNRALAEDRATLRLMAMAIREGLTVLKELGHPITPLRLKTISWLPVSVTASIFGKILASEFANVAFAGHAATAADEFRLLGEEFQALVAKSGRPTPSLLALSSPPEAAAASPDSKQLRDPLRPILEGVEGAAMLIGLVPSWPLAKRFLDDLGARPEELGRTWPGDELLQHVDDAHTRALDIDAPVEKVWPWLMQFGLERGGFHSYELLENMLGWGVRNVEQIRPEWQSLEVDQEVVLAPDVPGIWVSKLHANRYVCFRTWKDDADIAGRDMPVLGTWSLYLEPTSETSCRLLLRTCKQWRRTPPVGTRIVGSLFEEPLDLVMEQRMLRTIRRLAEREAEA